jgi:hypothetical protein
VEAVKYLGTGQAIDYDDDTASFQASIQLYGTLVFYTVYLIINVHGPLMC